MPGCSTPLMARVVLQISPTSAMQLKMSVYVDAGMNAEVSSTISFYPRKKLPPAHALWRGVLPCPTIASTKCMAVCAIAAYELTQRGRLVLSTPYSIIRH